MSGAAAPGHWQMSRREAWLSAGAVFAVALLVRIWAAAQVPFAIPEDTAYYWGVARNLAEGRGFVSDAIWSYATEARDPVTGAFGFWFPRAAFEIWLPLPSLLGVFPMLVGGSTAYGMTLPVAALRRGTGAGHRLADRRRRRRGTLPGRRAGADAGAWGPAWWRPCRCRSSSHRHTWTP